MAYEEKLAERVREALAGHRAVIEKKMFGGLCFLDRGNMCCGIVGNDLMVRVGPEAYETALKREGARQMDFTGRPMKGMVYVDGKSLSRKASLASWVEMGLAFTGPLPKK